MMSNTDTNDSANGTVNTVEIAADGVGRDGEVTLTGTRHILIDGEPLCNHPAVRANLERGSYHVQQTDTPVSSYDTCETCGAAFLRDVGSSDPRYRFAGELERGEWVTVTTEDGRELTGRVHHDVGDDFPGRFVNVVLSDEPMDRWHYGVDRQIRILVTEGAGAEFIGMFDTEPMDGEVQSIERREEPADSVDKLTADALDALTDAAGDLAQNTFSIGEDAGGFGLNTADGAADRDVTELRERIENAGFDVVNVVPAADREHSDATYIEVETDLAAYIESDADDDSEDREVRTDGGADVETDGDTERMDRGELLDTFHNLAQGQVVRVRTGDGADHTGRVRSVQKSHPKNRYAQLTRRNVRVASLSDGTAFTITARHSHEPATRDYPGYDGVDEFGMTVDGTFHHMDRIDIRSDAPAEDNSHREERDSDGTRRCDECGRQVAAYAPGDHAPDCSNGPEVRTDGGVDVETDADADADGDDLGEWFGVVFLSGVSRADAEYIMNVMEAVGGNSHALESGGVKQPDEWGVLGPDELQPVPRERIRRVLSELDREGKRPRPSGIADRLNVDLDGED